MAGPSLPMSLVNKLQKPIQGFNARNLNAQINLLRNIIFFLFVLRITRRSFYFVRGHGLFGSVAYLSHSFYKRAYKFFLSLPGVRSQVDRELEKTRIELEDKIANVGDAKRYTQLPKEPWGDEELKKELQVLSGMKRTRWEEGKVSGAVYHGGDELLDVQAEAMKLFSVSNPIHADVFPAVRKMEAEIVAMVLHMFNAPSTGAGATTSGGTESILMACLSARQKAYTERGVTEPEIILPSTAHAAFNKAANYFKLKIRVVQCTAPSYKVNIAKVKRFINPNTVLLVGSAPNYPHGIVDDIPALSKLAVRYKIPLHVDCCLGSFLMPSLAKAGFASPYAESGGFDFRNPGVTSISVDTHKYGFAPKGNSVILYRHKSYRQYQYFICPEWSGGVYGSPSIAGSRPGALIAGAWASMMSVGEKGYVDACHKIVSTRITIQNAIQEHPVLRSVLSVMGEPMVSVVAFESIDPVIDIYDVSDAMTRKGWHLNSLQDPPGVHIAVTLPMTRSGAVDSLITDLLAVIEEEKSNVVSKMKISPAGGEGGVVMNGSAEQIASSATPSAAVGAAAAAVTAPKKKGNSAQLYGVAGSLPDKSVVERIVVAYLDTLYKA